MPLRKPVLGLFLFVVASVAGPRAGAQGPPTWEVVGGGEFSVGAALSGFMALDPATSRPIAAYQDATLASSRASSFDGSAWQPMGGPVSFGTGWYHPIAFGSPPGETGLAPFVFMRDYGNPFGDGTLAYFRQSQQAWTRINAAASVNGAHDAWLDLNASNQASPYYNVPVVSLADRDFNPTLATPPFDAYADGVTVKQFSFATGGFVTIGSGGFDSNVTATTVRVTDSGTIFAAYLKVVSRTQYSVSQQANVRSFDPATNAWVPLGPVNFSSSSGGAQINGVANLTMALDKNQVPWVAFYWAKKVIVMKYDPAANAWSQVGGPASGPANALLPQEAWRYRIPLAFDSANRPYVFYSLYFPTTAVQDAKGVVRRFNGTGWELVGASGFTPGGASYHSMQIDPYDAVYCCFRNMLSDRIMVMKLPSPCQGPPAIGADPASTVCCGSAPVTFSVAASGGALTYQWRKDGANIAGATAATLAIPAPEAGDEGSYDVVVTNGCGAAISAAATLAVVAPLTITGEPVSQTACPGAQVVFTAGVLGDDPAYQWRKDGVPLAGATGAACTIGSATPADAGSYDVVVSNACGALMSAAATLTVNSPVAITAGPASQTVCAGAAVQLSVEASGATPLGYQWRKDGVDLQGETGPTHAIPAASAGDAGSYDVVVTNSCGAAASAAAVLTVDAPPAIAVQPAGQSSCSGEAFSLAVTATGASPVTYQWRKDGTDVPGATSPALSIPAASVPDAGAYEVVVANGCGSLTSDVVTVAVMPPVIAASSPSSIAPLLPASPEQVLTVNGSCFTAGSVVHANGAALRTSFVDSTTLTCVIGPSIPQVLVSGGVCLNVLSASGDVSNSAVLVVGSGTNAGTIRRHPLAPSPGETYAIVMEGAPPFAVFSLFADFGQVAPVTEWPDAATGMVLSVSPVTGSAGPLVTVFDGLGVFGPATGSACDAAGSFVLPAIVLPNPPLGSAVTIQAAYVDPSSPIGLRLTWARFPEQI